MENKTVVQFTVNDDELRELEAVMRDNGIGTRSACAKYGIKCLFKLIKGD